MKHALGIARALDRLGHEVHLVARSLRAPAAHSHAVHATHLLPAPSAPDYAPELLTTARTLAPVSLVPVGDGAVRAADRLRDAWGPGVRVALPLAESLAIANDKARTGALARTLGVTTPGERTVETIEEALAAFRELGPRVVMKGRHEAGVKLLRYVQRESELPGAFEVVRSASGAGPLMQQYVGGEGFGYFALYWNGQRRREFMHRRVREWPPSGGSSTCAESVVEAPALARAGRALLDALAWHGVAMVEFKKTPDDRYVLIEINAKFWGSHDLALAAGVNFPGDLVALLEGRTLVDPPPRPRAVRFAWPLGGDLWHGIARPTSLPRVLWDALRPGVAHSTRLSDPWPTLYEVVQCVRSTPGAFRQWRELA